MTKNIFAAFLFFALLPAARAEQAGLLRDMDSGGDDKSQVLGVKIMEDSEGVVILEGEKPADKKDDPAQASGKKEAVPASQEKAPAAAKKEDAPAAAKKETAAKKAVVKPAEKTAPEKPAAAKPSEVKPAAVKTEKVEALPATFELQAPVKPAPAAAPTPAAAPVAAKPAAAPVAKPAAAPAAEIKPAVGEGFAVDKKHTVSGGETLWGLSGKYYNDPFKWGKIYNANLGTVQDPDRIYPDEELVIPGITEEVRPEKSAPAPAAVAAPEGEGGVSDLRFEKAEVAPEGEGEVSDVTYSAPAPADAAAVVRPGKPSAPGTDVQRDDLEAYSKNDLSSEMPTDQKEWSTFIKVVPDSWQPDAVVAGRVKTSYDSVDDGLSVSGEKVSLKLSPGISVKEGDILTIYLRGAAAFDKKGRRIGRELQPAGTAKVISAGGGTAVVGIIDASSSVRKGMVAKVTMRF